MTTALWHLVGWLGLVWARAQGLLRWQEGYNTQTHGPTHALKVEGQRKPKRSPGLLMQRVPAAPSLWVGLGLVLLWSNGSFKLQLFSVVQGTWGWCGLVTLVIAEETSLP